LRRFSQALQSAAPAVTVELTASPDRDASAICRTARQISQYIDGLVVSERTAQQPVSAVALAALLLREGVDPVPRIERHGRNRIALLGDLLGLRALGVTALLLEGEAENTARPSPGQDFTVGETELIAMANDLEGADRPGQPHEFLIGRRVAIAATNEAFNFEALAHLAKFGLRFLQIQPGPDPAALRNYLGELVARRVTWQCSVIVTLDLRGEIEGCAEQAQAALALPGVSGIHLLCGDDVDQLKEVMSLSGIGRKG
jgi:hypothetical protein